MNKRPMIDYVDPGQWAKKEIEEKVRKLGRGLDFPEEHGFYPVPFIELKPNRQEEVIDFYIDGWRNALEAELLEGKIIPRETGLRGDEAIKDCVWDQLITSSKRFPEGQVVLVDKLGNPVVFTRSQIISVIDIGDNDFLHYPQTWYEISGDGKGYPYIPLFNGSMAERFMDYQDVLNGDPLTNSLHDLILSCYALSGNMEIPEEYTKGSRRAAVIERARFAIKHGINHCHTCSPLNEYGKWKEGMEKKHPSEEFTPENFIQEKVEEPMERGEKPETFIAVGMHMKYGARSMDYFPNGRIHPSSGNTIGICIYF